MKNTYFLEIPFRRVSDAIVLVKSPQIICLTQRFPRILRLLGLFGLFELQESRTQ
jgi:hypothetical protein